MIYLDHAATTPVPRPVADAMYQVLTEQFGNPSSQYPLGREAKALVEDGRAVVAGVIRVSFGPETTRADIDGLYQALLDHKNQRFPML